MKSQFFHLEPHQIEEIRKICDPGTYCVLDKQFIPSVIPPKLKDKCHTAVVVASSCDRGVVYCINLQRIDHKNNAIDQMPYAVVTVPNMAASSCLLHHADYPGRTNKPNNEFLDMVTASGIEKYFHLPETPHNRTGPISELSGSSYEKGFLKAKTVIIEHDKALKERKS